MKPRNLYIDQYGNRFYASTVQELREQIKDGGSRVSKMYVDSHTPGKTYHVGYVIGGHWLNGYIQMRNPA
jgi:hypothetical protein